jgi:predicted helicase
MACAEQARPLIPCELQNMKQKAKAQFLFLVPSIALLGTGFTRMERGRQTRPYQCNLYLLRPAMFPKRKTRTTMTSTLLALIDLALPASTDPITIFFNNLKRAKAKKAGMTVVFSTYQSIDVIAKAQKVLLKNGFKEFDLIICDEAHRTTGVTVGRETDEKDFTKVHNANFIQSKETRLYMTATPRLYSDDA